MPQQTSMIPQQRPPDIKGFSLTQPWGSGVIEEFKLYKTRDWHTNYRGLIAIHASKGFPGWARELHEEEGGIFQQTLNRPWGKLPLGAILGGCRANRVLPDRKHPETPSDQRTRARIRGLESWPILLGISQRDETPSPYRNQRGLETMDPSRGNKGLSFEFIRGGIWTSLSMKSSA